MLFITIIKISDFWYKQKKRVFVYTSILYHIANIVYLYVNLHIYRMKHTKGYGVTWSILKISNV